MPEPRLLFILAACGLSVMPVARADYINDVKFHTMEYRLSQFDIPASVGASSYWADSGSIAYAVQPDYSQKSYMELSVDGTLLADGSTWATSNPGIGIQFKLYPQYGGFSPGESTTAPNYRMNLNGSSPGLITSTYAHLYYRIVRLRENVPAGKITSAPQVTMNIYNPDGKGPPSLSGLIYSGIGSQPAIVACTIAAPQEITLPDMYGNSLENGAIKSTRAPTIQLTRCPGAINGITYTFSAVYGIHDQANSVINTAEGKGYAKGVWIQLQNADGTAHSLNTAIPLGNYTGSGDYAIPDFNVAYYIDDKNSVTAGNVKTALEFKLAYN